MTEWLTGSNPDAQSGNGFPSGVAPFGRSHSVHDRPSRWIGTKVNDAYRASFSFSRSAGQTARMRTGTRSRGAFGQMIRWLTWLPGSMLNSPSTVR